MSGRDMFMEVPVSQVDSTMAAPSPDAPSARADRLTAAEQDTGVKLLARVTVRGTNHGPMSVVGASRP
jgi:hypothetical protein